MRSRNLEIDVIPLGCIIVALRAPDRNGKVADIVLGCDTVDDYLNGNSRYFGAVVGRYANRIRGGRFVMPDGQSYQLACNVNGVTHLHGGLQGYDKKMFSCKIVEDESSQDAILQFSYTSPDMEEGYPGTLIVTVRYTLRYETDQLVIDFRAVTDKATHLNLTQHSYFNLHGHDSGKTIEDHRACFPHVANIVPMDDTMLPAGVLRAVEGTPFDFRSSVDGGATIGSRIDDTSDPQIVIGRGYDHTMMLDRAAGKEKEMMEVGWVRDDCSGRQMRVWTTQPGFQFYTGNFLNGTQHGKGGVAYIKRAGFCIETHHVPDSPNQPQWPTTLLTPGEQFHEQTIYAFGTF
jgi:aldose 1-epimerase